MLKEISVTYIYVWKTLGYKVRKVTRLKFHKTMELSCLMYGPVEETAEMRLAHCAADYAAWDNEKHT